MISISNISTFLNFTKIVVPSANNIALFLVQLGKKTAGTPDQWREFKKTYVQVQIDGNDVETNKSTTSKLTLAL